MKLSREQVATKKGSSGAEEVEKSRKEESAGVIATIEGGTRGHERGMEEVVISFSGWGSRE